MVLFIGVCRRLDYVRICIMRMRRQHTIELARYFQRLENIEKRKLENERQTKNNFMVRFIRRLGLLRNDSDRLV